MRVKRSLWKPAGRLPIPNTDQHKIHQEHDIFALCAMYNTRTKATRAPRAPHHPPFTDGQKQGGYAVAQGGHKIQGQLRHTATITAKTATAWVQLQASTGFFWGNCLGTKLGRSLHCLYLLPVSEKIVFPITSWSWCSSMPFCLRVTCLWWGNHSAKRAKELSWDTLRFHQRVKH